MNDRKLEMWTIYDSPSDFRNKFVARKFVIDGDESVATDVVIVDDSIQKVREAIPKGLVCITRSPADDPVIVETWF